MTVILFVVSICLVFVPLVKGLYISTTQSSLDEHATKRQFGGLFGTDIQPTSTPSPDAEATHRHEPTAQDPFLGFLTDNGKTSSTTPSSMTTTSNLLTTGTPDTPFVTVTSHSVIGTPAPMPTAHPKWFLSSIATYPATTVSTPPPTPTPTPSSQPSTISGVPTEWKVLGIAVIAISVLGISVLCIVFFDTWWRFIKDVLCCGMGSKDSGGEEELVPDWEKRSWAVQLRDEGGCGGSHRYPSVEDLTAPEGVLCRKPSVKERQEGLGVLFPSRGNLFDDIISEPTEAYGISRGRVTATRTSQYETAPHANVGEIYPPKLSPSPTMTEAYGGIAA